MWVLMSLFFLKKKNFLIFYTSHHLTKKTKLFFFFNTCAKFSLTAWILKKQLKGSLWTFPTNDAGLVCRWAPEDNKGAKVGASLKDKEVTRKSAWSDGDLEVTTSWERKKQRAHIAQVKWDHWQRETLHWCTVYSLHKHVHNMLAFMSWCACTQTLTDFPELLRF